MGGKYRFSVYNKRANSRRFALTYVDQRLEYFSQCLTVNAVFNMETKTTLSSQTYFLGVHLLPDALVIYNLAPPVKITFKYAFLKFKFHFTNATGQLYS